jgi:hypothetical protein
MQAVLVGGYALIANKVQRLTFDIDFIVTEIDCSKIEQELIKAGYSIFNRQDAFLQFRSDKKGKRDIDFLISDQATLDILISQGKKYLIDGETFIVPSPTHLIAMKLHSIANNKKREFRDLPDIIQLILMNEIDPKDQALNQMFVKYDLMELYEKVLQAVCE